MLVGVDEAVEAEEVRVEEASVEEAALDADVDDDELFPLDKIRVSQPTSP